MTAVPDSWDSLRSRLTALLARRAAAVESTAAAWAGFARRQGWTAADLDALWEGLTEDVLRRYARPGDGADARARREDVVATMAAIRDRMRTKLAR